MLASAARRNDRFAAIRRLLDNLFNGFPGPLHELGGT
jgi:hypothetical protein